jgi:hypothetical protein
MLMPSATTGCASPQRLPIAMIRRSERADAGAHRTRGEPCAIQLRAGQRSGGAGGTWRRYAASTRVAGRRCGAVARMPPAHRDARSTTG